MSLARTSSAVVAVLMAVLVLDAQAPGDKEGKTPAGGKNADLPLVERLMAARKEYQMTLEGLRKHYIQTGDIQKARLAEEELIQFHRMNKPVYSLVLEIPPPTLKG